MGVQENLIRRVKKISIVCICINLLLILSSQFYLLFEARIATATNNLLMEDKTLNPQTIKEIFPSKEYVCNHKKSDDNKKLYYENKYRAGYVTMIGIISILEVFVDLPINILLLYAAYSGQRKLLIPWLTFNGIKIIVTVILVSVFVIYAIIGVDNFKSSKRMYDIVLIAEDNKTRTIDREKR